MPSYKTISPEEFLKGGIFNEVLRKETHSYRAELVDGKRIVVKDAQGNEVKVQFGGTSDNRTVYAYIEGVGFIGGWEYPHKKMPWAALVAYINMGILYRSSAMLPTQSTIFFIKSDDDPQEYGPYTRSKAGPIAEALTKATGRTYTVVQFDPQK